MSEMITFKYLREIQKKERSSAGLCKVDVGFYGLFLIIFPAGLGTCLFS